MSKNFSNINRMMRTEQNRQKRAIGRMLRGPKLENERALNDAKELVKQILKEESEQETT